MADANITAADALAEAVRRTRIARDAAARVGREVAGQQDGSVAGQPQGEGTGSGSQGR